MQPAIIQIAVPEHTDEPGIPAHNFTCYEWGQPSAAHTVLCVHGLTRNGRDFDFLARQLAPNFRILCPDMPGRGNSERLPAAYYNYPTYLADIFALINQLELEQLHWLGTSMGGILGMMTANHAPGLIASLTLNDIGCFIPADGLRRILRYAGKEITFATEQEAHAYLRDICQPFGITAEKHWQHFLKHSITVQADGNAHMHYDPAITAALQADDAEDVDLWPMFEAVKTIPTMLIRGEESDILTEETASKMATEHPQLERYNAAGTGHAPALMSDEQIKKIVSWLNARV